MTTCPGGTGSESCCTSLEVPGGTYDRSYDGLSAGCTSTAYPATVSGFRLDAYEVTVGRFRQFVAAWDGGWRPAEGAGLHSHVNDGKGLNANGGGYESGWDATDWNDLLATTASAWLTNLHTTTGSGTWTATAGTPAAETLPISTVDWYEAYAYCIWDGGFLPSEAEWNYAAAGGSDQRVYPWSPAYPPGSTAISCADANYALCPSAGASAVGSQPAGNGKWGQADLEGNVTEWNLDSWDGTSPYATPCVDCASAAAGTARVSRGSSFLFAPSPSSHRGYASVTIRQQDFGFRCSRTP